MEHEIDQLKARIKELEIAVTYARDNLPTDLATEVDDLAALQEDLDNVNQALYEVMKSEQDA